jgi:hypothetical protein
MRQMVGLVQRRGIFYFRRTIPEALRAGMPAVLGTAGPGIFDESAPVSLKGSRAGREFWVSLATRDEDEARSRARRLDGEADALIRVAKRHITLSANRAPGFEPGNGCTKSQSPYVLHRCFNSLFQISPPPLCRLSCGDRQARRVVDLLRGGCAGPMRGRSPVLDLEEGVGALGLHHAAVPELITDHLQRSLRLLQQSAAAATCRRR